jgi:hypothetical protein
MLKRIAATLYAAGALLVARLRSRMALTKMPPSIVISPTATMACVNEWQDEVTAIGERAVRAPLPRTAKSRVHACRATRLEMITTAAQQKEGRLVDQIGQHSAKQHPAKLQVRRKKSRDRTSDPEVC